jgi:hypothetical protein
MQLVGDELVILRAREPDDRGDRIARYELKQEEREERHAQDDDYELADSP